MESITLNDNHGVVFRDGIFPRDVAVYLPGVSSNIGCQYGLDTTALPKGNHAALVKAIDNNGNVATYATQQVTVNN